MSDTSGQPFQVDVVPSLLDAESQIGESVAAYFSTDPAMGFTGRFFEQMVEHSEPDEFTPWDLAAVSTLSVNIPPDVAAAILLPGNTRDVVNRLLRAMPDTTIELGEAADECISVDSPAAELYQQLRNLPDMGPTRTSKLLAAKRPRLIPIRDSVVEQLLGAGESWWEPMRQLSQDQQVRDLVDRVSDGSVPDNVSYLRRLDVVLWTHGMAQRASP